MNSLQLIAGGLVSLILAACGGGGSTSLTDGSPATTPTTPTPPPPAPPITTPPTTPTGSVNLQVLAAGTEKPVGMIPGDYLTLNQVEVACQGECPNTALFKGFRLRSAVTPDYLQKQSSLLIKNWKVTLTGKPVTGSFQTSGAGDYEFRVAEGGIPLTTGNIVTKVQTDVKMGHHGFSEEITMAVLTTGPVSTTYTDGVHGRHRQFRSLGTAIAVDSSPSTFPATAYGGEIGYIDMVCPAERVSCISGVLDFDLTGMKSGDTFSVHIGNYNLADVLVTEEMKTTPYRLFLPAVEFAGGFSYRVSLKNNTVVGNARPSISGRLKVMRFEVGTASGGISSLFFQAKDCTTDPVLARSCTD